MGRPSKYSLEFRESAVRLVLEQRDEYPSEFEAIRSVGAELGVGHPKRCASGCAGPRSMVGAGRG